MGSCERVQVCLQRCDVVTSGSGGLVQMSLCFQPHDAVYLRLVSGIEDPGMDGKCTTVGIGLNHGLLSSHVTLLV